MSFSFNDDLSTELDMVRFKLGDITTPNHLMEDETIAALILVGGSPSHVALACARSLRSQFARKIARYIGPMSVSEEGLFENFTSLVIQLEDEVARTGAISIHVGGYSKALEEALDADTDIPPLGFDIDMHEDEEAVASDNWRRGYS
jgi:hypothetical protein